MPPHLCAPRPAGGPVRRLIAAAAAMAWVAAAVAAGAAYSTAGGIPPAGAVTDGIAAVHGGSGTAGAARLSIDGPALPGVITATGPVGETARDRDSGPSSGQASRSRGRRHGPHGLHIASRVAGAPARQLDVLRLAYATTLHRISVGHESFHCDTPPPERV